MTCLVQAVGHNERLLLRQHARLQLSSPLIIAAVAVCPAATRCTAPLRAAKPAGERRGRVRTDQISRLSQCVLCCFASPVPALCAL